MSKHRFIGTICCLYLFVCLTNAYNLKHIGDKEYMPNSSITTLCQDEKGLMWIGTCDGLTLYDGQNIEAFLMDGKDDYLSGNLIDNIIYTGEDVYWIQTYYGLNRLDKETNTFTHYNEFKKMFFMSKDKDGNLFVVQDSNCIYYYHKQSGSFKKLNMSGIPLSDIIAFFIDENNLMWIVTRGYNSCYAIEMNKDDGEIQLRSRKSPFDYNSSLLYCFYDNGAVNYIDKDSNLYSFDIASGKQHFIYNLAEEIRLRGKISSLVKYHDSFFIGFTMDGVLQLVKENKTDRYAIQVISINSGVFCLKRDNFQDIVWIGTDGQGIYIYSNTSYSIQSVVLRNFVQKTERPVRALFLDKERTFWIGTKGNGILKLYEYGAEKNILDCRSEVVNISNSELGSNAVYCFAKSARNLLWIGDEEGLNYYSYKEKRIRKLDVQVNGVAFKYIHDIYETAGGELWLASVGLGIVRARITGTADRPELTDVSCHTINHNDFESNYFFTIYPENDNRILFGNRGYGAFYFNETIQGLEPVYNSKYENMTLNNILAIDKDSTGNYLLGTSFGLIKYRPDNTYRLFNMKDGFLNNTIHDILKESPSAFWLSTNMGLIHIDTSRDVFHSYGYTDGLEVVEFSDGAAFKDEATGVLFFGGVNGFVSIRSNEKTDRLYMPPVYFDKLSIFGESHNILQFVTSEKKGDLLHLKYNQNFFAISFTATDYLNGNNYIYYYKLDGVNDQWINNGSESTVSFTNMPSGEYALQVKYYNSAFDKESSIYTIRIRIDDPWYASTYAFWIYGFLMMAVIVMVARILTLRSQRKKQAMIDEIEKQHQRNVFESKLRFFTNIAHEFCTPLTLIYGPCGRILASQGLNKFVKDYVQMIQANAERLSNLIHELIEFRRIETGNRELRIEEIPVSELVKGIARLFVDMAKSKNIMFLEKIPDGLVWNSDKGFLSTIVINLISNAFKYTTDGRSIKIEVELIESELIVRVANEGSYIEEKDFESIFNRYAILDNFENRDDGRLSRNGLGLAISYNMAKLLNGTIRIENRVENANWVWFTVTLPAMELLPSSLSKTMAQEYIPQVDNQPIIKLPQYEFDKMRPTLLVVDDEIEMLWFIGEIFSDQFNVVTLQEPEKLDQVLSEVYPSVIVCDVRMPGMGGIELTKKIKSDKETAHIPVIIVSGQNEMEHQMAALAAGAEMYITKPFDAEYLRLSVCQLMERKEKLKTYFSSAISSFEKAEGKLEHKESKKFMQSILRIVNDNITNKELSPKFIADQLAISLRSLYRKMDEIGEESPTVIIRECRLHVAKDLLLTTKKTIDEIVFESGFSNKVTFFKVFREKFDCTPKEFRMSRMKGVGTK